MKDDLPEMSECMNQPMVSKYVSFAHQVTDMLMTAIDNSEDEPTREAYLLRDTLYTVISTIEFDNGLEDLNSILRMHYPAYYKDASITEMPITTSN